LIREGDSHQIEKVDWVGQRKGEGIEGSIDDPPGVSTKREWIRKTSGQKVGKMGL
jgi:hypothetical protein